MSVQDFPVFYKRLGGTVGRVIAGQDEVIRMMGAALVVGGHVLLEGPPGTAKTLMVRAIAAATGVSFSRVQFTPDLMPSDITGSTVFDTERNRFYLRKGPVFTHLLLADEINRTPPRTQAALLEAMQERAVTIDGERHRLEEPFVVFATENPIEYQGTYPLPEAQLDRFLFKVHVDYPPEDIERDIFVRHAGGFDPNDPGTWRIEPIIDGEGVLELRSALTQLTLDNDVVDYVLRLIRMTRQDVRVRLGASPRSGTMLIAASRAMAAFAGRSYVTPDDIKEVVLPTLRHRLVLEPEAELDGVTPDAVLLDIMDQVEVPR